MFVVLIFLTYFKSPRNTYTYIVIVILVLAGGWISYFQYNSEKLANYTETNWKEDREYQVYRLRDMILKKEMKNLTENEIKYLLGKPEEIVKKNKGKRYEYIYQGTWGIHEWTNYLYIFFDESGKSYDYKIDVIDAIDDRKNLKSPQY